MALERPTGEELAYAWAEVISWHESEGMVPVETYGPSTVVQLSGGLRGEYREHPEAWQAYPGNGGVYWVEWAVTFRKRHAKSKAPIMIHWTADTPDDIRSIGLIHAKSDGILVFSHPMGPTYALIEDRLVKDGAGAIGRDAIEHAKWLGETGQLADELL